MRVARADYCAIDFGTSNSALTLPAAGESISLVELEPGFTSMPTAVFYFAEGVGEGGTPLRAFGRAAIAAYVEGVDGRLMRSMKSILGSSLFEQRTDIGAGRAVRFLDVVAGYLRRLKSSAESAAGTTLRRAVLGRPVFFVDDDARRDAQAERALASAARAVGFEELRLQYEPIAAAFDYERRAGSEQFVLVADIGGGTSDFSLVRVGPERMRRSERKDDILANHGVHLAGTDFDRRLALATSQRELGYGAFGPRPADGTPPREVPSRVYFDLATWHLINTVYAPQRVAELRAMRGFYADARQHRRLMTVLEQRLGHALAAQAEQAKIDVAEHGTARIDLSALERGLQLALTEAGTLAALEADLERIVRAASETAQMAGLAPDRIDALFFTGGSTGLAPLVRRIAGRFASARVVRGDRFASVATGLGLHARRVFGAA
jgi:hypothetical chaperone protein